jgi:predicted glycoside hydrolase/deacetylase ChbG (UPF0249 family)
MRWLVVNADDAGFHRCSDAAILACARHGLVRSATVAVNGPTAEDFVRAAKAAGLDLGLHLNLSEGRGLGGPHRTLTDRLGHFLGKAEAWRRAAAGELDAGEVRREVEAQWARARALGFEPTHVDGHNHVHLFPAVREALRAGARGIWVRVPLGGVPGLPPECARWAAELEGPWNRTDAFTGHDFARAPAEATFLGSLVSAAATVEFMVHPGARPGTAFTASPARDRETQVLCAAALLQEVGRRGFGVASFPEVGCA